MGLNNFENHLKTSLRNMEEEVDVTKLMAAISPIKTRKKKKGIIFSSIFIVTMVLIGSTIYLNQSSIERVDSNSLSLYEKPDQTKNDLTLELESSNSNKDKNEVENIIDANTNLTETTQNKTINKTTRKNITNRNLITRNTLTEDRNNTINQNNNLSQEVNIFAQNEKISAGAYFRSSEKTVNSVTKYELVAATSKLKSSGFVNLQNSVDINGNLLTPKQVDCPTFVENPWILDFGTVMGLSKPNKTLTKKTTDILPAYASRATNEKSLEGLDLELYISAKRARWPVFFKTGLNYSRWSERMKIEEDYTEVDTIQGIISITTSESGDTIKYIYGDIYVERDVEIRKNIHYYINRLDIPVSVLYEKEFGNHALQVEAGTRINFSTFARGLIYNNSQDFSVASQPSIFKRITGLNYFGKLHYRYYLNNHSYLGAQAYYQYIPADFSSTANNIGQKYTNYGLGLYYGFRF